jgi:cytochrome c-type biogenesis protein CcsB
MNIFVLKNSLDNLSFLCLLGGMISYWVSIAFSNFGNSDKVGYRLTLCANFLIFTLLSWRWLENGYFPLSNLYESLLFFTWGLTFIQLVVEYNTNLTLVGAVTTPLATFVVAFATLSLPEGMQKASPLVPALKSNWLMMHVSIMMLSYSTLILGSLLSILFLVFTKGKEVDLKGSSFGNQAVKIDPKALSRTEDIGFLESEVVYEKSSSLKNRLSLLESLDNLSYRIIGFGFPLLTIGIIAGAVWANEAWGSYWSWDPKETWALITWLVFAAYLHSRIIKSWQGKKPAIFASVGFVVVWCCYLGVNFIGKGLHSYGWIL